ncbi:(3S,6E)-nerolidol synthase 2, chloroplastic/mitochondrial-like [Ipomoea triloba]|uniref:(3S,6E)-nerolidol synthase 2, chloroplastic/mitochondrial-like n=1 Tax=Ipomoea triloba TaxID=35885 RepID=UPI00125DE623|nr:(3S,6E)-nerolidol synthase 2, chloroplastic/mitochondrial-like [Ipomoea triloba]
MKASICKDEFELKWEGGIEEGQSLLYQCQEDGLLVLPMIDVMQRLGIDYHFQELIEAILHRQYHKTKFLFDETADLHDISLRFRLFRQEGYPISSDVFTKFTDEEGKFKEELISKDIKGLMALHEASHLAIQGEDILEEAERFSRESLMANMTCLDDCQAILVQKTLQYPHHKSLPRFTAKTIIENMRFENAWEASLVNLATMEYSITQSLYQEEFRQILL